MSSESTRRLAAIMIADIAGYTRLMESNERGTHAQVQGLFRELIGPTITEHRGRLIKTRGDGFLAMFDSPVEAVRCAIVIQQSMVGRNLELPNAQWVRFRIGVNLGDVIVEPDDIYGEGVNVAARLEQLAEPGTIYISGGVYEQIRYKLVCGYQSLGDRKVKNIADPVPIYRVLPDPASLAKAARGGTMRLGLLAGAIVIATGLGGGFYAWRRAWEQPEQLVAVAKEPVFHPATPTPTPPVIGGAEGTNPPPATRSAGADPSTSVPPAATDPAATSAASSSPPALKPAPAAALQVAAVAARLEGEHAHVAPAVAEPEMIFIPGGTFRMGSNDDPSERPAHNVTVGPFQIAKYPVTVQQWRTCVAAKACNYVPSGPDEAPVNNVSWTDANQFIGWLSQAAQRRYRLPTEAEWEFTARGRTETRYWWGDAMKPGFADCKGCGGPHEAVQPTKVGTLPANPFGVHDMGGGLSEWVQDCWHKDYRGAPADGSAWLGPDCRERVLRGGSWRTDAGDIRAASRDFYDGSVRYPTHGMRLARSP